MKKLTALIVALSFVGLAAPAFAQSQDKPKVEFVTMERMDVNGGVNVPGAENYDVRGEAKFGSLTNLKRSFVPQVRDSANASALD